MIPLPCYEILHQASLDWKPANVYREEPAVWQQPDRQFHTKTFQIHNKFFHRTHKTENMMLLNKNTHLQFLFLQQK